MFKSSLLTAAVAALAIAGSANAAVVTVTGATAHNGGNWPSTLGHISDSVNGNGSNTLGTADHNPGMDISADPNDPSTWLNVSNSWQTEWLGDGKLDATTSANNKIGYFIVDFGSVVNTLENMYLWASQHNTGTDEDMRDYNLYYSSGVGIDALPSMPNSRSWANGSKAAADYNFSNGDWTQIGSTNTLASPSGDGVTQIVSLGGVNARYIGIEIMTAGGTDPSDRVGFAQVEFTVVPEPGSLALLGLGSLLIGTRRRRG